ncbi:MAG: hypothetical protein HY900_16480 [Deltaproteobacteria bacterium]|nr:hypothetical protein [Deltaproteobacteria bacterium]
MKGTPGTIAWIVLALAAAAPGCYPHYRVRHQPTVPTEPVNVGALNSEADDMNAIAPPRLSERFPLVFSTNRFAAAGNRLAAFRIRPSYSVNDAKFFFDAQPLSWGGGGGRIRLEPDLPQYGPVLVPADRPSASAWNDVVDWNAPHRLVFTVATADAGLDLYVSGPFTFADLERTGDMPIPSEPLAALNTNGDESYLAFGPGDTAVLVADGDLVSVSSAGSWEALLAAKPLARSPLVPLNSPGRETAVSILGDYLLFVSDRPGGVGGLDVYLSRFVDGAWGSPDRVARACSPADEMRPVLLAYGGRGATRDSEWLVNAEIADVDNLLLLFSSNRPGGRGGYDFYYVGLPRD